MSWARYYQPGVNESSRPSAVGGDRQLTSTPFDLWCSTVNGGRANEGFSCERQLL